MTFCTPVKQKPTGYSVKEARSHILGPVTQPQTKAEDLETPWRLLDGPCWKAEETEICWSSMGNGSLGRPLIWGEWGFSVLPGFPLHFSPSGPWLLGDAAYVQNWSQLQSHTKNQPQFFLETSSKIHPNVHFNLLESLSLIKVVIKINHFRPFTLSSLTASLDNSTTEGWIFTVSQSMSHSPRPYHTSQIKATILI